MGFYFERGIMIITVGYQVKAGQFSLINNSLLDRVLLSAEKGLRVSLTATKLSENSKNLECNSFGYCVLKQLKLFYSNRHRLLNLMVVRVGLASVMP